MLNNNWYWNNDVYDDKDEVSNSRLKLVNRETVTFERGSFEADESRKDVAGRRVGSDGFRVWVPGGVNGRGS